MLSKPLREVTRLIGGLSILRNVVVSLVRGELVDAVLNELQVRANRARLAAQVFGEKAGERPEFGTVR